MINSATTQDAFKKLGQLLVERGWVTGEQLIRAIQSQRLLGGRIGTCLLEMDVVTEDQLLDTLSLQLHVPPARIDNLRGIEDEILDLVPAKLASRGLVVPFAASKNELKVATLQVRNLALLDELSFAANRRVAPHIASEVRLFEALEKYYGFEIPRRFGHLLDRLNRSRYLWDESATLLLGEGESDDADGMWKSPEEAFEKAKIIVSPSARGGYKITNTPGRSSTANEGPATSGPSSMLYTTHPMPVPDLDALKGDAESRLTLELVDRLLAQENEVDRIAEIVLRFAASKLGRVALFRVRQQHIVAWQARIDDLDGELFSKLEIAIGAPSLFRDLLDGAPFVLGPLAPMPAHRELAQCWGGELPREVLLLPLRVRDRLVGILYGDRGAAGFEGVAIEDLQRLVVKASMALELCILRKKLKTV